MPPDMNKTLLPNLSTMSIEMNVEAVPTTPVTIADRSEALSPIIQWLERGLEHRGK